MKNSLRVFSFLLFLSSCQMKEIASLTTTRPKPSATPADTVTPFSSVPDTSAATADSPAKKEFYRCKVYGSAAGKKPKLLSVKSADNALLRSQVSDKAMEGESFSNKISGSAISAKGKILKFGALFFPDGTAELFICDPEADFCAQSLSVKGLSRPTRELPLSLVSVYLIEKEERTEFRCARAAEELLERGM